MPPRQPGRRSRVNVSINAQNTAFSRRARTDRDGRYVDLLPGGSSEANINDIETGDMQRMLSEKGSSPPRGRLFSSGRPS